MRPDQACRTTTPDRSPICWHCQLHRQLEQTLGADVPAPLRPLLQALRTVEQPRTVLGWLARSPAVPVLAAMANSEQDGTDALADFLNYYNFERNHSPFGWFPPVTRTPLRGEQVAPQVNPAELVVPPTEDQATIFDHLGAPVSGNNVMNWS